MEVKTVLDDTFRRRGNRVQDVFAKVLSGWVYLYDRTQKRWSIHKGLFWRQFRPEYMTGLAKAVSIREHISLPKAKQIVGERIDRISPKCLSAARKGHFNGSRISYEVIRPYTSYKCRVQDMEVTPDELVQSTKTWVRWYARTCRENKIVPFLLFFPESGLVTDAPCGPVDDDFLANRPSVSNDRSITDMLLVICREQNVIYLDCTPVLKSSSDQLFLRYDGHPTARAYELVARFIAEQMSKELSVNLQ